MTDKFMNTALVVGALVAFAPVAALGAELPKKGSTEYTSHYVFKPLGVTETKNVGTVTALEMEGTTTNTKGEPHFDELKAKCHAVKVDIIRKVDEAANSTAGRSYINGACAMIDADGDTVFSTFDTRRLDKSKPEWDCGTHIITGGTGKYKGITGKEPFKCINKDVPAGSPAGAFAIDIPHTTTWEINGDGADKGFPCEGSIDCPHSQHCDFHSGTCVPDEIIKPRGESPVRVTARAAGFSADAHRVWHEADRETGGAAATGAKATRAPTTGRQGHEHYRREGFRCDIILPADIDLLTSKPVAA